VKKDEKDANLKSKRPVFDGVLCQPIEDVDPLIRAIWVYKANDETRAAIDKEIREFMSAQYAERIMALAERYGIDPRAMNLPVFLYSLLIRLAAELLDGFRIGGRPRLPGRPKGTGKIGNRELWKEVWALRSRGKSVRSACTTLAKQAKYRGEKPLALQARFNRYDRTLMHRMNSGVGSDNYKALEKRVMAIRSASR
jgi:hypothetical protein